ncbi:MAG: cation:proton antiporter, partial [Acidobacteria bacterium]|nr:cation:proton antiporter [Acidobacteriota bacterium]
IKERLYIGEATIATLCGVIFGPVGANLINPLEWGNTDIVAIEFSRVVLVVTCFAVGVELPRFYMERHWKSVIYLLLPVMTFGWLVTSLLVWWMVPALSWLDSLVVAACVTPTDPVLASSVVGKGKFAKRVPKHLRDLLSSESGCNDGMAFPFVYLALYLISEHLDAGHTTKHWFLYTILYECVFGAILGFAIGYAARHAIRIAEERDWIDRESLLSFYFVLSLFCAGAGSMLGVDDLLVGFAAGVGFSNDGWFSEKTEESHVSNVIDLLLNVTYFVFFGTIVPWSDFNNADIGLSAWRLVVMAILILLLRRIPIMLALKPLIPDIKTWREALFAGHFGPMGVGAIFIALLARAELEHGAAVPLAKLPPSDSPNYTLIRLIWPIVTFIVITSIIVHGSSIAVFALGKRINTLKLTMSYTTGDDNGKWMNRLPRISTQTKSQMKTDDEDDEGMPQFPPGTLPPVGMPNNFLRRQRDEEGTSRSSSRVSRRRGRRGGDNEGHGGPVSQSAIGPVGKRPSDLSPASPEDKEGGGSRSESESRPGSSKEGARAAPEVLVYEEGPRVVFESAEGEVLGVTTAQPSPEETEEEARAAGELTEKKEKEAAEPFEWSASYLKRKVGQAYENEVTKRKQKANNERKHEPAQAYQYGNTVSCPPFFLTLLGNSD